MKQIANRRKFVRSALIVGAGLGFLKSSAASLAEDSLLSEGKRIGMIGLDTSHCPAFTKLINSGSLGAAYTKYKVVAAYPTKGSADFPASIERLPGFTKQMSDMGIEIVASEEDLLKKVDLVLLESVDGRVHLEQALAVLKAGKPMFIDKPISSSLAPAIAIFEASKKYKTPVFSSSDIRFVPDTQAILQEKIIGNVLGADTYSPFTKAPGHPELFFYGIHGVELLFSVMGAGCKEVVRLSSKGNDIVIGIWDDGRIGTVRRIPPGGKSSVGGAVFGVNGISPVRDDTYDALVIKILDFFQTGVSPVKPEETLEILAFMEAADKSKRNGGVSVSIQSIMQEAKQKAKDYDSIVNA